MMKRHDDASRAVPSLMIDADFMQLAWKLEWGATTERHNGSSVTLNLQPSGVLRSPIHRCFEFKKKKITDACTFAVAFLYLE